MIRGLGEKESRITPRFLTWLDCGTIDYARFLLGLFVSWQGSGTELGFALVAFELPVGKSSRSVTQPEKESGINAELRNHEHRNNLYSHGTACTHMWERADRKGNGTQSKR